MNPVQNGALPPTRMLSLDEVQSRTTLSKTSLWRRVRAGTFPASVSLGGHRRAWREAEVTAWLDSL